MKPFILFKAGKMGITGFVRGFASFLFFFTHTATLAFISKSLVSSKSLLLLIMPKCTATGVQRAAEYCLRCESSLFDWQMLGSLSRVTLDSVKMRNMVQINVSGAF